VIRHIVMWTLRDNAEGADKSVNAAKMKALLESCRGVVSGMRRFDVVMRQAGAVRLARHCFDYET